MNNETTNMSTPPPVPPIVGAHTHLTPLGEQPGDDAPLRPGMGIIEAILRQPRRVLYHLHRPGGGAVLAWMLLTTLVFGAVYGLVAGTFSGGTQLWAAPLKIAGGLVLSAAICFPSLYIFACLSGSRASLLEMAGFAAGLLVLTTLLLIGFAPVAWLFSQSTESILWMGFLHVCFWLVATLFGVRFLRAGFIHSQARSSAGLLAWVAVFMLVSLQMTTALRPILGKSDSFLPGEKRFFLSHWAKCADEAAKRDYDKRAPAREPSNDPSHPQKSISD